jgi:hypothetical protein
VQVDKEEVRLTCETRVWVVGIEVKKEEVGPTGDIEDDIEDGWVRQKVV